MSMPYQCVTMGLSRILVIHVKKNKSLERAKKGASILLILHGVEETLRPRRSPKLFVYFSLTVDD